MTSTASQPTSTPAPNTTAASTATSYASAAGATKKSSSTPLVVTGANPPAAVAGSSAASGQNAKSASGSNLNGRQSVSPAVPTVANGTSSLNGDSTNHGRNGSVTIAAPGNGYNNKTTAPGIQFGFEKTPQPTPAAPVTIPGSQRIPSPAHSPSPIPQPSASGGKPGSTENAFKIGSFTNDGDVSTLLFRLARSRPKKPTSSHQDVLTYSQRMAMRPTSMQMSFHNRRDSSVSQHSDMGHHGGQGPNRGGFPPQGGRGRGFNPQYNGQMGFPPNNFPRGPHGPNRGGMPSQNFGRGGMQYPNSPQPTRGSPAMPHAMPGQGTPNMNAAMPVPPQYGHQHQYPPPMSGGYAPQVKTLSSQAHFLSSNQKAQNKKKGVRWDPENKPSHIRQLGPFQHYTQDLGGKPRRLSKQRDSATDYERPRGRGPVLDHQAPPWHPQPPLNESVVDLTPGSQGFARFEQMLTANKQNFNNYGFDPTRPPYMAMPGYNPQMPMPGYAPGSPAPGGYPYAPGGQFAVPQGQPMSRNNSQMSERPASAAGNANPMVASGPPQPQKPIVASSTASNNQFVRPERKLVKIRNAQGEEVNLLNLTTSGSSATPSPAPTIQSTKTPPIIASTPTPPPKVGTPVSHGRNESTSTAKPDEIKAQFLEKVKKSKEGESSKTDEKPAVEEAKPVEETSTGEPANVEEQAPEAPAAVETEATEAKSQDEPKDKGKAKDEAEPKVEEEKADATPKADVEPEETEDERIERMIREMEEEDARREAEQAEITAKKNAEKEVAKKKAEEERLASAAENDRKLREQEREMERLEEEKERKAREQSDSAGEKSISELLAGKISDLTTSQKKETSTGSVADKLGKLTINSTREASALSPGSAPSSAKSTGKDRRPAALNLAPLKTGSVEAPPPSAAMQALKSARFLTIKDEIKYPVGISSPNPATNAAAAKKGGSFKYDSAFLLQFQKAFTEQPSVEFSQQVKALIGDSDGGRSASTRGSGQGPRTGSKGGPSGGAFGSFAQPASGKPLPPGTTSDQRFAMAQGQMARPMSGAMSFGRGGGFPGPSPMTRTASGLGMNSRSGSRTQTRGSSKQGQNPQAEAKLARTMPLTQGMDLKPITTSSTGWKPMSLARSSGQSAEVDYMAPDVVQRKVKAALNKMTPENFEKISKQILEIAAQSKDETDGRTLRQVIQLTFEKATDEAHWAAMYAKFCKRMLENMSPEVKDVTITDKNGNVVSGGALFRKYLLNRCQEDFERGWNVDMPEPKEGESKETALMSDEYYKAMTIKRRGLGLVQFIGELFKLGMLTERIMHECVRKLLDFKDEPDEAEIESLSKLLRTIGGNLDSTEKGHAFMNAYFERITNLTQVPDLPSRLKFMLMDIIDLRKKQWAEKEGLKGPKTLDEIRAEVSFPEGDQRDNSSPYVLIHSRLRLLPLRRLLRLHEPTPDTSQEVGPSSVGVMHATLTIRSTRPHLTLSQWTICAASRAPHHGLLAAMSLLARPRCSTLEATVAASWALAARSHVGLRTLAPLPGLEPRRPKRPLMHLRKSPIT